MYNFKELKCYRWDYLDGFLTCIVENDFADWYWQPKNFAIVQFIMGCSRIEYDGYIEDFIETTERLIRDGYFYKMIEEIKEENDYIIKDSEKRFLENQNSYFKK